MIKKLLFVLPLFALLFGAAGMSALTASPASAASGSGSGSDRTIIALKGSAAFPNAKGKAAFRDRGSERELQVEVENVRVLAGTTVSMSVGGVLVGTATVNALGAARLSLNTNLGDSVPVSVSGKSVEVRTAAGVLVVSGSF